MLTPLTVPFRHRPRGLRVHVPAGPGPHPVLLLFDGQNVFDDATSYAGGWHADAAVDKLPRTIARPLVVGLDNGGSRRIHELWAGLDELLECVLDHVIPQVQDRWEVAPAWVVGGASMGGLAAFAAHLRHPDVFRAALCMSPAFWATGRGIFDELDARGTPARSQVYIDAGAREGLPLRTNAAKMAVALASRGYDQAALTWRYDRRGGHRERDWARRLPRALKWLFRR